jgi:hypothetical protein
VTRTLTLAAAFDLDRSGIVWAFVVNDPTRLSSDLPRSVVERPDDETKVQIFAETLETGRVRIWHFLSG